MRLHVPVEFIHRGQVLVEGQGGIRIGSIGLEVSLLCIKVELTVDIFGVEGNARTAQCFNLQVGRIGTCLERSVGDQFGGEFTTGPFEHPFPFQTGWGKNKRALVGVSFGFEQRKVFRFTFHIHRIPERQPVHFYVLATRLGYFYSSFPVFGHEEFPGSTGHLFGFEN